MNMQYVNHEAQAWLSSLPVFESPLTFRPVKQDASFRVYVRVQDKKDKTFILCKLDKHEDFVGVMAIQGAYETAHVAVPSAMYWKAPYIIFEDLGDTHLKTYCASHGFPYLLQQQVIDQILHIQRVREPNALYLQSFDKISKQKEFVDLNNFILNSHIQKSIESCIKLLLSVVLKLPKTPVHRDFHWENLLIYESRLRVLDYSDTMWGPPTYDLASLIADRKFYQSYPKASADLIQDLYEQLKPTCRSLEPAHFWASIALRLFKIIGNFDRLSRDIRPAYKEHQAAAFDTLSLIPWEDVLPESWRPDKLREIAKYFAKTE